MILGFAHLAINTAELAATEAEWVAHGYSRTALHAGVACHPSKAAFMSRLVAQHDLLLMQGTGLWPLELTCHGPTDGHNAQLAWGREAIALSLRDLEPARRLLLDGLGFRADDSGALVLHGRLPQWRCRLQLVPVESSRTRLDASGPSCLAFYCTRIEEDAAALARAGAVDVGEPFELVLGGRALRIAMLRMPGGPVVELIHPRSSA